MSTGIRGEGTPVGPPAAPEALTTVRSLYLHIPFCERKCAYCDFMSVGTTAGETEYVQALRSELRLLGTALPGVRLDTVFAGGGTPGLLDPSLLAAVMAEVRSSFTIAPDAELTLEANPSSTSEARADAWLRAGFNRVSLGLQSLEPDILAFLDRVHDGQRGLKAVAEVRAAGFVAVNCDLIYAVPGLDDERWRRTLDRVLALAPDHLSCYELTVEPGTPLHVAVRRGRVTPIDAEAALHQHWITVAAADRAGLPQYEVSNFARLSSECRHNLVYWRGGHYLAAGVAAHGHLPAAAAPSLGIAVADTTVALRYWHGRSLPRYESASTSGRLPIAGWEEVDAVDAASERLLFGLRLAEGVQLQADQSERALPLVDAGLLVLDANRARLTERGQEVLDQVALRLVG